MDRNNSYNLSWPSVITPHSGSFTSTRAMYTEIRDHGNERYLAEPDWSVSTIPSGIRAAIDAVYVASLSGKTNRICSTIRIITLDTWTGKLKWTAESTLIGST